jgi:putative Mg2+ transporter-C (MgtC) family protein
MYQTFSIEPLKIEACLIAIFCGFLLGFERQWFGKPAGIRTSILVCMGAYAFIALANFYQDAIGGVRVLGSLVTGVGFLGAGMMLSKEGIVQGVTSAAIIWILAAIGCLIGFGNYQAAVSITLLTLFTLIGVNLLERAFKRLRRGVHKILKSDEIESND